MFIFGVCFVLYLVKLSAGKGFWTNLQKSDPVTHKLAVQYQRSLRRLSKAELDRAFLRDCKKAEVYPKFVRWKNINQMKRNRRRQTFHKLLLNEAIKEKNTDISNLRQTTAQLKTAIFEKTTWMKAQLIVVSVNRFLSSEKNKVKKRHAKKLEVLFHMKVQADKLESMQP